jgi:hypothetical protein
MDDGEKKKKKGKKRKKGLWHVLLLIPIAIGLYLYFAPQPYLPSQQQKTLPRLQFQKNVNTTSVPYTPSMYSLKDLSRLLERHLRQSSTVRVLCMHHLDFKRPYRACSVHTQDGIVYFMVNPRLDKLHGDLVVVNENSQSCKETFKNKRWSCARISWLDGTFDLSGEFCGDVAINLQLVFDEFLGSGHCRGVE